MSLFAPVPDGFYEPSRLKEQLLAVSSPTQFELIHLFAIITATALTLGSLRAVIEHANAAPPPTHVVKK